LDGISWTAATINSSAFDYSFDDVAYGDGKWVAVMSITTISKCAYSTDGINWTESNNTSAIPSEISAVAYGGGKFVAVSSDAYHEAVYSTDGINWTESNNGELDEIMLRGVAYGGDKWVAVGLGYQGPLYYNGKIVYSLNGISWTAAATPSPNATHRSVAYADGKWVAVGDSRSFYSTDGINWTVISWTEALQEAPAGVDVAYGNGKFVVGGSDSGRIFYSSDGINWLLGPSLPSTYQVVSHLAYGGGKWVVLVKLKAGYGGGDNSIYYAEADVFP
jgi:hypothetical protein